MELRTRSTVTPDVDVPSSKEELLEFLLNIRPAWHDYAACNDGHATYLNTMFPKGVQGRNGHAADPRAAQKLCRACPVAHECAQAGHNEHHGVWGGVLKDRTRWRPPPSNRNGKQYVTPSRDFVRDLISSQPHRQWTAVEVANELGTTTRAAQRHMRPLTAAGLITVTVGGRDPNNGARQLPNTYKWKGDK